VAGKPFPRSPAKLKVQNECTVTISRGVAATPFRNASSSSVCEASLAGIAGRSRSRVLFGANERFL